MDTLARFLFFPKLVNWYAESTVLCIVILMIYQDVLHIPNQYYFAIVEVIFRSIWWFLIYCVLSVATYSLDIKKGTFYPWIYVLLIISSSAQKSRKSLESFVGDESNKFLRSNVVHLVALTADSIIGLRGGLKHLLAKSTSPGDEESPKVI